MLLDVNLESTRSIWFDHFDVFITIKYLPNQSNQGTEPTNWVRHVFSTHGPRSNQPDDIMQWTLQGYQFYLEKVKFLFYKGNNKETHVTFRPKTEIDPHRTDLTINLRPMITSQLRVLVFSEAYGQGQYYPHKIATYKKILWWWHETTPKNERLPKSKEKSTANTPKSTSFFDKFRRLKVQSSSETP